MINSYKILSSFVVLIISVLLIYISFFSTSIQINNNYENNKNSGISFLSLSESGSVVESNLKKSENGSGVFLEKISLLDEIYSNSQNSYKLNQEGNNLKIELKNGIFIFNINDSSKNYEISFNGFIIKPESFGKIFINTNDSNKPLILSLDSTFQLNLTDENSKILTKTYLYPHQYIKLNFSKDLGIKNIDSFRISQLYSNGYIKESLFKDNKILDKLALLFGYDQKSNMNILNIAYKKISLDSDIYNLDYEKKIKDSLVFNYNQDKVDSNNFSSVLFVNNKKDSITYKNKLYKNIINLFNKKDLAEDKDISDIKKDLDGLKKVDLGEYNSVLNTIYSYTKLIILSDKIEPIKNFDKLMLKIGSKEYHYNESYISLNKIYKNYDIGNLNEFDNSFSSFLNEYIVDYNLNTLNNPTISDNLDNLDSFLLFFNQIIIKSNLLSNDLNVKIDGTLNMLNKYFLISNNYYFNSHVNLPDEVANTGLYQNLEIIRITNKFILNNFFESDYDGNNLLVLKSKLHFNADYINKLSFNIQDILKSIYIRKTDFLLEDDYNKLSSDFDKYFLAILDYNSYKLKYSNGLVY